MRKLVHAIGFDDAPFERAHRGDVAVVGAVYSRLLLEGVLIGRVRRDGRNATRNLASLVQESRWAGHVQVILLQGIALAGFNVIDVQGLARATGLPVLVVARRRPDSDAMRRALEALPGGRRKWRLIERPGPMEPAGGVYVQRAGLTLEEAVRVLETFTTRGGIPEPLRAAHAIAGALVYGESRGRV